MRCQGKFVDLDVKSVHLSVGHHAALAFILLKCLQVGAQPLQLEGPLRVVTIIHLIQASKLVEMVPNVVGLVIVPSVLVVNELYMAWREKQRCLDKRHRKKTSNDYDVFSLL